MLLPPWCLLKGVNNLNFFWSLEGECLLQQPWNDRPASTKSVMVLLVPLYLLSARFLRNQIALMALIINAQKVRSCCDRKEHQHSLVL